MQLKDITIDVEPELGKPGVRLTIGNRAYAVSVLVNAEDLRRLSHFFDVEAQKLNEE